MNNYQPMKKPRLAREAWKRRAKRSIRLHRKPSFFRRMLERRRRFAAHRKMRGHPNMTLYQGFMAVLLDDIRRK